MRNPEHMAGKLFNMLNCRDKRVKAKGKKILEKIKTKAKAGNKPAKIILDYLAAIAKTEKADRAMMGLCK